MITLLISMALLVLGYIFYGSLCDKVYSPDAKALTPAYAKQDGIDFMPMPTWKVFMIQFLNIAGTGPIFGAILGAKFGPSCYLWIVLGCIFGGAMHDYFSGMLSLKHGGAGLPDIIGEYLGKKTKAVMLVFSVVMLLLVGAVFVYSPAIILGDLAGDGSSKAVLIWVFIVLAYYIVATLVPIDKIIGKIYPLFAVALIFMAVSLFVCLIVKWPAGVPEIWDGLQNRTPQAGAIFPCLFISIACGAISGFHATQSPLMARCIKNQNLGKRVYYGSMITEGLIALVWAAVSSYFFYAGGNVEMGAESVTSAPAVVTTVSKHWLGAFGSVLAMLGVVAAPITSGDTALRSARLIVADAFKIDQAPISKRLLVAVPIFVVTGLLLWFNVADASGFDIIWRYFGWANQTLAVFTLWAITSYLYQHRGGMWYLMSLIPAVFMTAVCTSFICTAKIGFNMPQSTIPYVAGISALAAVILFVVLTRKLKRVNE